MEVEDGKLLKHVYQTAPIGLCVLDTELRYRYINYWLASINGLSVEAHLGRRISDVIPDVSAGVESLLRRVMVTGEPVVDGAVEAETPAMPHQKRIFQHSYDAVISEEGIVVGVSCVVRDITSRKRAEDALVEANNHLEGRIRVRTEKLATSEERLRRLLESTDVVPWEADAKTWLFTYVGPQAVPFLGYPLVQWYEKDFWIDRIHPEDRDFALDYYLRSSLRCEDFDFDYRMVASDGRVIWVHNVVSVDDTGGIPHTLRGFMANITERKLAQDAVQELSGRLIEAQENERGRIARELHDNLSQKLALLAVELERTSQDPPESAKAISQRMRKLLAVADELSTDVHNLSHELHPSSLEHIGLTVAVRSFCNTLAEHHNLRIEFSHHGVPEAVPSDVSICIYRIVQESLRNVLKHSGVAEAQVALFGDRSEIRLTVTDKGVGFNPSLDQHKLGLGLVSMRERVHFIGGNMSIKSDPSGGTRVDVRVPLPTPI
ncbi:MAG: PAS domain S-box protein [Myxococcales bacterium]|nr:PAS domain S-box protein [Myxococcales bacterium]